MTRNYEEIAEGLFGVSPQQSPQPAPLEAEGAVDTSGGIASSLNAQPGMMEQTAREGLLSPQPAAEANQDGMTAMSSADDSWKSPLSGVLDEYGIGQYEPGKNAPRDPFPTIQNRNDTLRGQMVERDSLRSELGIPGDAGAFSSDLQRAAFMLNAASQYSQDDAFSAFAISKALNMPFEITLDNKEVARNLANEFTPEKIKDFAPKLIRLAQYDYDSVLLWRHDLATANAVAGAFEGLDSNRLGGLSGGLRYAGADGLLPDDPGSNASAAARGLEKGYLGIAQGLLTAGKFGLELPDRLGQGLAEGIASTIKPDALPVENPYTEPQRVSQWFGDMARASTKLMGEVSEDAPYGGKTVWDNPEVMLDSRWWLENGISTVMSSLPAIAAYAAGGALPAAAAGMAMEGANMYNDLIAEGLPDDARTRAYSAVYSVIAGALEATGVESMFGGSAAVKTTFKNMLKGAAEGGVAQAAKHSAAHVGMGFLGEGGTEWLQNIAQGGLESAAKGNTGEQIFNDVLASAKEVENFVLGAMMGGPVAGFHARSEVHGERLKADIMESVRRAANAPEMVAAREEIEAITRESAAAQSRMAFAQSLEKAAAAADSSTVHQTDPALFEQEAAKLIPEEARAVWLDVATVQEFTQGDPARLEALGLTQQDIEDAVATGAAGVQVPTMAIVARFQGEDRQTLMQSARPEPGGMTQEEAQNFDPAARSEEAASRIRSVSQTSAEVNKEKTRLKQEFVQAGYPAHMAEYYSTLHAAQARAFADRYGLDPVLLLRQRSVVQASPEGVGDAAAQPHGGSFFQPADSAGADDNNAADAQRQWAEKGTESPYFKEWFGDSKVVDEQGKPLVVYHGTGSSFDSFRRVFDVDKTSQGTEGTYFNHLGFFFSSSASEDGAANSWAKGAQIRGGSPSVIPAYVSLKNPFVGDPESALDAMIAKGLIDLDRPTGRQKRMYETGKDDNGAELKKRIFAAEGARVDSMLRRALKEAGYDGLVMDGETQGEKWVAALDPTQIKSVFNRGTFDSSDPRILRQSPVQKKDLVAAHNLSEQNLQFADKIGGLPVPSIGITKAATPFDGFGNITLIGHKDMVDPSRGVPVFSADAYSARFPEVLWPKVKAKDAQKFRDETRPYFDEFKDLGASNALDSLVNSPNRDRALEDFTRGGMLGARAMYADQVLGKKVAAPMRDVPHENLFIDEQLLKEAEGLQFKDIEPGRGKDAKAFTEAVKNAIDRKFDQMMEQAGDKPFRKNLAKSLKESTLHELMKDGELTYGGADRVLRDIHRSGEKEVDVAEAEKQLDATVPKDDPAFLKWAADKIGSMFGDPSIKVGGRKVPMSLENLVDAMSTRDVRGKEKTMTFGGGRLSAEASKQFKSIEEIQAERDRVVSPDDHNADVKSADKSLEAYRTSVLAFFTQKDYRGDIDTWAGLDASMKALADAAKKGGGEQSIRSALTRNGFKGVNARTVSLAKQALDSVKQAKVDYFEAKPQRGVKLNEFMGAVIPAKTSPEARAILEKNGLRIAEYDGTPEGRAKAVDGLSSDLEQQRPGVLFQPAYHGSPYRFDKFTLDHIGSGEGAQAFGWGMYFAGRKNVAEFYRETLSKDKLDENPEIKLKLKAALQDVDYLGFDNFGQAVSAISTHSDWATRWEVTPHEAENINGLLKKYREAREGQLYKVDIPEDHQLLLWDKPLSDQPEKVRAALNDLPWWRDMLSEQEQVNKDAGYKYLDRETRLTGEQLYHGVQLSLGSDEQASKALNSIGIKGIKYLDGTSRGTGEGSYNYVIFDDSAINILQTYYQQQRGAVSFGASGDSITSIFKDASDPSTPIHEGAHVFINDLIRVVADNGSMLEMDFHQRISANNADAQAGTIDEKLRKRRERAITQNYETRRRNIHWTARGDLEALVANANAQREAHGKAIGEDFVEVPLEAALNGSLTPEQMKTLQEVNATGFEAYVREGKAPSDALRGAFHRMKEWLKAIYRALTVNGVQPTPEVARVFDRMLATDAAIDSSKAGAAMSNEAEFFEAINGLGDDASAEWSKKDRINYKAALNKEGDEFQRLQELYTLAEAEVSARMDKEALRERNQRWKAYYAEGKEIARDDVFYDIMAALTVKKDVPFSGISREWLERMYGKGAVADLRKTAQGRKIINSEGGMSLDAVGISDIVGNSDRAEAMGISDADGLYNYLYDNIVVRKRSLARDAKAYADQRLADDDRHAEKTADVPGEAYRKYLDEVEALVLRMAAREGAAWRTPEQQARWVEQNRMPLATVRRQVREVLRGKPLREIMPNMYVGEVRAALQNRNAALLAGNARDALAAVDRARMSLESWIEANRIIKERESFEKQAARLAVVKRDVIAPEAYTAIQNLLERFQTVPKRAFRDAPKPLQEVVDNLAAASGAVQSGPSVAEWLLKTDQEASYKDLNVEQLQDVKDLLAMLERTGRDVLASNKASEAAKVKEVADAGADSMAGLKPDILAAAGSALRGWQDWSRKFFSSFAAVQWQMRQADGFTNLGPKGKRGVNEMRIYGAIVEGESRREVRMRALTDRLAPVFQRLAESAKRMEKEKGKAFMGADRKPLAVPESMRQISRNNWTADNVIAMALNLGNEGNAARLREGFPDLKPEVLAQLLGDDAARLVFREWAGKGNEGLLLAKDWRDVQEIWDTLHTQWSDIRATHERLYGFKPRGVEAREITLSIGGKAITLPGGYYPAVYDPQLSKEVAGRNEKQDALARGEAIYAVPAARKGFTQGRANSGGGLPLMLSTGVVMSHLNDVTRFIELAETVRFADRVTQSPQWAQAYTAAFGKAQYDAIRPNLKNIVLEDRPPMDAFSIAAEKARAHLIPWGLGWNFKTALLQSTALFPAMNDLGAANVMRGVSALGIGRYGLVKEIWENSPYMKSRASNIDQDLRQAVKSIDERTRQKAVKLLGAEVTWDKVVEAGMLPLLTVDMATSSAIWLAAYNKEMVSLMDGPAGKGGIDPSSQYHKSAVLAADMAVKAVNPDFNPSSRSAFLRDRGVVRLLNMFSSAVVLFAQRRAYNAQALKQAWHRAGKNNAARLSAVGSYARYEAYDFLLPAVAMGLLQSLAGGSDDPDKWAKNVGSAYLDAFAMRLPVAGGVISGLITNETWRGMSTVFEQPVRMGQRIAGAIHQGNEEKMVGAMADALSFLTKIPVSRVVRSGMRGYAQWQRGDGTPLSLVMPSPGK